MSTPIRLKIPSLFWLVAVISLVLLIIGAGCPVIPPDGGSGNENQNGGDGGARLSPGTFVTIRDPAIHAGQSAMIEFTGPGGYRVITEAQTTREGSTSLPLPPLIDAATGESISGELTYCVIGSGARVKSKVAALPSAGDTPPGAVLRIVLQAAAEEHERNYGGLTQLINELEDDAAAWNIAGRVSAEAISLRGMISNFDQTGHFTLPFRDGSWHTMTADEMRLADRWLAALICGMAEQAAIETNTPTAKLRLSMQGDPSNTPPDIPRMVNQGIVEIRQSIRNGAEWASVAASGVGISVALIGLVVEAPLIALVGAFCAVGGAVSAFVGGAAGAENTDAFLAQDPTRFDASAEALSQTARYGLSVASSATGPVGRIAQAADLAVNTRDFAQSARTVECADSTNGSQKPQHFQARDAFCQGVAPAHQDPISPADCPAPDGSLFIRKNTGSRYQEYWLWPPNEAAGKKVGLVQEWYGVDKRILASQVCKDSDGQSQGLGRWWRADGALHSEATYADGMLNGPAVEYYPSGAVLRRVTYRPFGHESRPDGLDVWFFENGRVSRETTYVNGQKNGPYRDYFESNGIVESEGQHVNGQPHGTWYYYNLDGTFRENGECLYAMGDLVWCR